MKKIIYDLLSMGPLAFSTYQRRDYIIDPKRRPSDLIDELTNPKQVENLVHKLNARGESGEKVLRMYTIVHWCLIYEPALC